MKTQQELRDEIHKLLDFFTEPGQGEKYLKDLENAILKAVNEYVESNNLVKMDEWETWLKCEHDDKWRYVHMMTVERWLARLNDYLEHNRSDLKSGTGVYQHVSVMPEEPPIPEDQDTLSEGD